MTSGSSDASNSSGAGAGGDDGSPSPSPSDGYYSQAKDWVMLQMDRQRIERLQQCRILQDTLADCRKAATNNKPSSGDPTDAQQDRRTVHLEQSQSGLRFLKYFKWRNVHDHDDTCQRETHAVWGCRAVALQCGRELQALKECFDRTQEVDPSGEPQNVRAVLGCRQTAYEAASKGKKKSLLGSKDTVGVLASQQDDNDVLPGGDSIPCRELQELMGQCIAANSKALAKRHLARAAKQERHQQQH